VSDSPRALSRRQLLLATAASGSIVTAGCLGDTDADTDTDDQRSPAPETASPTPVHADYETTVVRVETGGSEERGRVTAAIADTPDLQYTGLSETTDLPEDRGMLFVYEGVADRAFVMREMDFGIDIVYAGADGRITTVHHAPASGPSEDGEDQQYPGRGQYVLEVNYDWTTDRGVGPGDYLRFDLARQ